MNHYLTNCAKAITSLLSHNWDIYTIYSAPQECTAPYDHYFSIPEYCNYIYDVDSTMAGCKGRSMLLYTL